MTLLRTEGASQGEAPARKPTPKGGTSVRQRRHAALNKLDYFPTPPWATRAVLPIFRRTFGDLSRLTCWEPACGGGHMVGPLLEAFATVIASDVFDWASASGRELRFERMIGPLLWDFVDPDLSSPLVDGKVDIIATNPPFIAAETFVRLAMARAKVGVAVLVRSAWLESIDRYERLFRDCPPTVIAQYVERVPMFQGRWEPNGKSATAYAWVIWERDPETGAWPSAGDDTQLVWIPPGQRDALTLKSDFVTFAEREAGPLFVTRSEAAA